MGEAKRRRQELDKIISGFSAEQKVIFDLAQRAYDEIIRAHNFQGACYHMTYFLKAVLHKEHGIEADAVIGFINDGTDDIMISHGWLEYQGRKVDIAAANPNHGQTAGPVLILDYKFQEQGTIEYSYHRERGERGELAIQRLGQSKIPEVLNMIKQKEHEHSWMISVGSSVEKIMEYLNSAPNGATYDRLLQILKH